MTSYMHDPAKQARDTRDALVEAYLTLTATQPAPRFRVLLRVRRKNYTIYQNPDLITLARPWEGPVQEDRGFYPFSGLDMQARCTYRVEELPALREALLALGPYA